MEKSKIVIETVREKKCPECGCLEVGPSGGSHQSQGFAKSIGLECYKCGCKFWMFESEYKP